MLVKPTVPELLKSSHKNRYSLVIGTAKRARQIADGSKPMTDDEDTSPVTLAADEIEEGKVILYDDEEWKNKNQQAENNDNNDEYNNQE